jgi:hypothetical protein
MRAFRPTSDQTGVWVRPFVALRGESEDFLYGSEQNGGLNVGLLGTAAGEGS